MIKQNIFNLLIRVKIVLYCFAASVLLYELIIDLLNDKCLTFACGSYFLANYSIHLIFLIAFK